MFLGNLPPYGYKFVSKTDRTFIIDDEVAPIVRDIFKWKAEGIGDTLIARRLNEMGISSPMKRRIEKGEVKSAGRTKIFLWRDKVIQNITTNPMYLGHMVQGKQRQALCDNMKATLQPKSSWVIVENTHDAIVDTATFDLAQEMRYRNTKDFYRNYDKSKHIRKEGFILKGLLICGCCGSKLARKKTSADSTTYRFICPMEYRGLGTGCRVKSISEAGILDSTLSSIKVQIETAADLTAVIERLNKAKGSNNRKQDIAKKMSTLQSEIKRLTNLKAALFESYADNLLTEDEYVYSKERYSKQIDEAKEKLEHLQEESVTQSETLTPQNRWLQAFRQFSDHAELSHDMVQTLINRVVVVAPNEYDFVWNFKGDYEALTDYARLGVAQ